MNPSDSEVQATIDALHEADLRDILKYMLLLNPESVNSAIAYIKRRHTAPAEGRQLIEPPTSTNLNSNQNGRQLSRVDDPAEEPPLLRSRSRGSELSSLDGSSKADTGSLRPNKRTSHEKNISRHSRASSRRSRKDPLGYSLLILCTSKPSSRNQGEDQDKAMLVCKKAGIQPFIVLRESRPTDAEQLTRISLHSRYPQFFLQPKSDTGNMMACKFLGDFDTVHQLFIQGHFNKSLLSSGGLESKMRPKQKRYGSHSPTPPIPKHVGDLLEKTSQFRITMQKKPVENYEESSDDSTAERSPAVARTLSPPRDPVPNHLSGMNQPVFASESDDQSIDSLGGVFDPPRPPPPDKPLLEAARKAAEQQKKVKELARGIPPHLAGMNEGESNQDDSASLGDDPQTIFDPPRPPPAEKPLLAAARRAAAQLDHAQSKLGPPQNGNAQTVAPEPLHKVTTSKAPAPVNQNPELSENPQLLQQERPARKVEAHRDSTKEPPPPPTVKSPFEAHLQATVSEDAAWMSTRRDHREAVETTDPQQIASSDTRQSSKDEITSEASSAQPTTENGATGTIDVAGRDPERGVDRSKSYERKFPIGGACYLVYDAVEGELNIYYSEVPIVGAVGVWTSPDIRAFKEAQGLSSSELIGNCAKGVQDRQEYYNGWCQFVKAAKSLDATVTVLDVGVPVDFYLYLNGTTSKVLTGEFDTVPVDAVACVPRNSDFPLGFKGKKWSKAAKKIGAIAQFRPLSTRDGVGPEQPDELKNGLGSSLSSLTQLQGAPPTIPEEEESNGENDMNQRPSIGTGQVMATQQQTVQNSSNLVTPAGNSIVSTEQLPEPQEGQERQMPSSEVALSLTKSSINHGDKPQQHISNHPREVIGEGTDIRANSSDLASSAPPPTTANPMPSAAEAKSPAPETTTNDLRDHEGYASAFDAPNPSGGASYLVYEPDSSGRLVEHYSKTPVEGAIGRWEPVGKKKIAGFKFKQNLGKTILIGNCSAGVQGRKNYSSGWCQYVRSARLMQGEVMLWDPVAKGLMVDVYVYQSDSRSAHQTVKLRPGVGVNVEKILAVACIPKSTPFYEGMAVDILKWLADGDSYGASSRF